METKIFVEQTRDLFAGCLSIMDKKGPEYAGQTGDKFANFKRIAQRKKVPVVLIWDVYFSKHIDSINSFIAKWEKGLKVIDIEENLSEPISGRIQDAINYLAILKGMIDEARNEEMVK